MKTPFLSQTDLESMQLQPFRAVRKWCGGVLALSLFASLPGTAQAGVIELEALVVDTAFTLPDVALPDLAASGVPPVGGGLVLDTPTLVIAPTGVLDLKNNSLIVRTTSFATVEGYVSTGYHGPSGPWTGNGVTSSTAAADATGLTAVGVINNADARYAEFNGRTLGTNLETLVTYTYYGDANLDYDVNAADLALMGLGSGWYYGDFNYSGTVDAADYALFNTSFNALHPVPEPSTVGLLTGGALVCFRRRRG